ncbi:hypothetical protein [Altererythrobacter ishigakiensis]|uniref:Uncharacterized protein n=1 Tax=Altererythrobacter ishigakiensis TaxID=476157 RepID=A0A562UTR0_9SPHN|nr:hypothetical protein [Altererythrobacter ishigakiensis]TWJ08993.1 hypothetical protein JN10_0615 [Altererythrobacter ishigakiensis]
MTAFFSRQTVVQQTQGRPPVRSDATFDRMSEEIARRIACGAQR